MARLSLSKKKMKRSKLAMAMQWWLYILHLLGLFMELAYRMVERQCVHGVRSRYQLDFYDNRDVIEKWVYKSDRKCMNDFRMPRRPFLKLTPLMRDGTHTPVQVPAVDRPRYRNRKGQTATNVLAACTPNLQFTYVLPGWEGSAADGRVLRDAINRTHGLVVPLGKTP
ncbi:uncharacterized protein LOC131329959 [Rhododendron vialii]|uniref:uncharacterized protein LOC131329959 n=1 Tax=Rhododendron vialii TaxID=182163 RepID=UPI00265E60C3|nr:uncharacterized protein LOC131329959 [Rhododendron vialii]